MFSITKTESDSGREFEPIAQIRSCSTCDGTGQVDCPKCEGSGEKMQLHAGVLRRVREAAGVTRQEFAEMAGCSVAKLKSFETDHRPRATIDMIGTYFLLVDRLERGDSSGPPGVPAAP